MELKLDEIFTFNKFDHARAVQGNKMGIIDFLGNIVVPLEYDYDIEYCHFVDNYDTDSFIMVKNGLCGVINSKNEVIIPFEYDSINFNQAYLDFIPVSKNGKRGIIDRKNKLIIDFCFDSIDVEWKDGSKDKTKVYYIAYSNGHPHIFNHLAQLVI